MEDEGRERYEVKMFLSSFRACSNELKLGLEIPQRREEFAPPTIYRNSWRHGLFIGVTAPWNLQWMFSFYKVGFPNAGRT
ncbi:hypothetical protein CEXT_428831 [Caerostris extrusa]|uniref:Uncharacterized protein n=1 Tax=Caerostris extrusa TaxID=172846 RepID=A0AAV4MK41_CAEEX|nr:hypothetical protein CEXT_428831 [Caerostris extrusa]